MIIGVDRMLTETKYQKLLILVNVILLLILTGALFSLYYPLETSQGIVLLSMSTIFPLLYFWALLFPIGRKHVKELNWIFFIVLIVWYCIIGIFYNSYQCLIFYYLLAGYLLLKKYMEKKQLSLKKVNQIFMAIVILLSGIFIVKVSIDYYKIIESSIPIIAFVVAHAITMIGLSLHFTMNENHFLEEK